MTDKEKIRAEIERLKESGCASPIVICDTLLSFINSMPVEPKFKVGDVVRSKNDTILTIIGLGQYCYHCDNDYSFGFDIQDEFELVEEPVSEDLEEVAGNYAMNELNVFGNQDGWTENGAVYDMIKATARHFTNWQKQQIIGKACEWVRTHRDDDFFELVPEYNYCGAGNLNIDKMVEEYRKYLEE